MSDLPTVPPARPQEPGTVPRPGLLDALRLLIELAGIGSLVYWGFASFDLPWNIVAGLGAPLLVIVVWALFISPKAVLAVHPFIRAVIELLIYVAVTAAWWSLDQPWIGLAYGVIAVTVGVLVGRRRFS